MKVKAVDYMENQTAGNAYRKAYLDGLLSYIEKYLSIDELERYYRVFAPSYPEKTLELFTKVLLPYAENNKSRSNYERIFSLLKKMSRIKGGRDAALKLIADFQKLYKTRKIMMEILGQF